ncbi:MAG: hypothetical protein D6766_02865 [Verrucomicrobia bacterium]|nr:MAG: hypothetical protein D6766_02865 [Verrucomicrobiota bacterium]
MNVDVEFAYDGTNTIRKSVVVRPARPNPALQQRYGGALRTRPWRPGDPVHITVYPGPACLVYDLPVNAVWLSFCATRATVQSLPSLPLPTSIIQLDDYAFAYPSQPQYFRDDLELIQSVQWLSPTAQSHAIPPNPYRTRDLALTQTRFRHTVESPPWGGEPNATVAEYRVLTWTNLAGWHIPTSFEYHEWYPKAAAQRLGLAAGPNRVLRAEFRGNATARTLAPGAKPPSILTNGVVYFVQDLRFRHPRKLVDFINYRLTNQTVLPPRDDPHLAALFEAAVAKAPLDPLIEHQRRTTYFYAAIMLLLVIVAGVTHWRLRRSGPAR